MEVTGGLIREKLPQKLEEEGYACQTRKVEGRELAGLLGTALNDAVQQLMISPSPENAAEALDLIRAAAAHNGLEWEEIEKTRKQLNDQQGGYQATVLEALIAREIPSLPDQPEQKIAAEENKVEAEMVEEPTDS